MTQEQKELLLKDLCSRLPYGVKLQYVKNTDSIVELYSINLDDFYCKIQFYTYKGKSLTVSEEGKLLRPGGILRYKPLLFPLSSMTEEQKQYLKNRFCYGWDGEPYDLWKCQIEIGDTDELIDWFHKNHLDYRCLIPMGLANDATGLNVYTNSNK